MVVCSWPTLGKGALFVLAACCFVVALPRSVLASYFVYYFVCQHCFCFFVGFALACFVWVKTCCAVCFPHYLCACFVRACFVVVCSCPLCSRLIK